MRLLLSLMLTMTLTGTAHAQVTVPVDSLEHLAVAIQLRKAVSDDAEQVELVEFDSVLAWTIAESDSATLELFNTHIHNRSMQKVVGFPDRVVDEDGGAALVQRVPDWSTEFILLNDMFGFEGQFNILTAWKEESDRLILDHVWPKAWGTGIGAAYLEAHARFPDESLLLITRRIDEGVYHNVEFWQVQKDYRIRKLVTHAFFGNCHPKQECDLTGYALSDSFYEEPVVHLFQTKPEFWGGVYDSVPVLDAANVSQTINLWDVDHETDH